MPNPNPNPATRIKEGERRAAKAGGPQLKLTLNKEFSELIRSKVKYDLGLKRDATDKECREWMREALADRLLA